MSDTGLRERLDAACKQAEENVSDLRLVIAETRALRRWSQDRRGARRSRLHPTDLSSVYPGADDLPGLLAAAEAIVTAHDCWVRSVER